jgi:hypothetical protein
MPDDKLQRPSLVWEKGHWIEYANYLETELMHTKRALDRMRNNAQHIFDKLPVRDWDETLAEADAVLNRKEAEERR